MRIFYVIATVTILALLWIISWSQYQKVKDKNALTIITAVGPVKIYPEIASTSETRKKGLMFKEKLAKDKGMLFIWPDEKERTFWMKNTLIPLDLIFVSKDKNVVETTSLEPCQADPCPTYTTSTKAQYVIEVNKNSVQKWKIQLGDIFLLPENAK